MLPSVTVALAIPVVFSKSRRFIMIGRLREIVVQARRSSFAENMPFQVCPHDMSTGFK
jgi:hypothetical protein